MKYEFTKDDRKIYRENIFSSFDEIPEELAFVIAEERQKIIRMDKTGRYAIYEGKEYHASLEDDKRHVEIWSKDKEDEDKGFKKHQYLQVYSKIVELNELSEFYDVEAVCDYMGKTHKIFISADGESFRIYVKESWYKEFGFTEEYDRGLLLGYFKDFKMSELEVHYIKTSIDLR